MTLNEAQRGNSFKGLKEAQRPLKETMLKDRLKERLKEIGSKGLKEATYREI